MQGEERQKGLVIGPVIDNKIVKDKGKKQKDDAHEAQEKGPGEGRQAGKSVDVVVFVKDVIKENPSDRDDHHGIEVVDVVQVSREQDGAILQIFSVNKEQGPGKRCHEEIGSDVYPRI